MKLDYVPLGSLRKPVAGVIPSGVLATDEVSNTCINYTTGGRTAKEWRWNEWAINTNNAMTANGRLDGGEDNTFTYVNYPFNIQGQKWIRDFRASIVSSQRVYGGAKNCATPRRYNASGIGMSNEIPGHILEFEFMFTGISFSMVHMNMGGDGTNSGGSKGPGGCSEMYVEYGGEMWMASALPKVTTRISGEHSYRNVVFNEWQNNTRIRFCMGTAGFTGIRTDAASNITPSPNRYVVGLDGDSYTESTAALTTDTGGHQYFTGTIANNYFKRTGFSMPQFGQGATGFFCHALGQVFDDGVASQTQTVLAFTVNISGPTRWFSGPSSSDSGWSSRKGWYTDANTTIQAMGKPAFMNYSGEYFGGPLGLRPLAHVLVGTWNDESSGTVSDSQMYTRAGECYDWVHSVDPYVKLVHVSPEPFDDGLFAGADGVGIIGPPGSGRIGDVYRLAQMRAANERDWVRYVNAYGPEDPWWTGMGPELLSEGGAYNVPANSQQAALVSPEDSIHGKWEMPRYLAGKIDDATEDLPVLVARVAGQV